MKPLSNFRKILEAEKQCAKKDTKITDFNKKLKIFEEKISELSKKVLARDQKMFNMSRRLNQKDAEILAINKKCQGQDAKVSELKKMLNSNVEIVKGTFEMQDVRSKICVTYITVFRKRMILQSKHRQKAIGLLSIFSQYLN